MVVFEKVKVSEVSKLIPDGFCKLEPKTIYEKFRCSRQGVTIILYSSGKLLLQGKPENVENVAKILRKKQIGKEVKPESFRKETGWIIGSDESLKGDSFGGLVVAAVKADNKTRKALLEIGVADSKKLKDLEILDMAKTIKQMVSCHIISLLPEAYNKGPGQTKLLNQLHQQTAKYLGNGQHVVDKYPGCKVGDIQETKAESKYLEVAAASILARAEALKQMDYLTRQAGFPLPKGSTHVTDAIKQLQQQKLPPAKFLKMHFSNVRDILNSN
tara:strand:- start:27888 stop:28703 length:816 start_codon:yes stop_codon:yes gene_type:complete